MARYIDAIELQERLIQIAHEPDHLHENETWNIGVCLAGVQVDLMPTADVISSDQYIELKCALDKAIDERRKYGVMYEELLKEKSTLENEILYFMGMIEAFKLVLCCGGGEDR